MTETAAMDDTKSIIVEETFPHAPAALWKALTTSELMARWIMEPAGFEPVVGNRFTYRTRPAGEWDGTIHCEIIEIVPGRRLVYRWRGGHPSNEGYGAPLDTVVTFELTPEGEGTRLRMTHSGFVLPRNQTAFAGMGQGWPGAVEKIAQIAHEFD